MEIDINNSNVNKKTKQDYMVLETIPIVDKHINYDEFFEEYLIKNQPCLIKNVSAHWKSTKYWLKGNKTSVNYKYLYQKYSNCPVLTYDCKVKHYNSHKTEKLPFQQYLLYWEAYKASNYSDDYPLLYLKDWHLKNTHPEDKFYKVPSYFSSDWLNEYLVGTGKDDYRFVYMGPKGTWTPFHADVFRSYSWSVNIIGKKHWILLPPGEEESLKDRFGNLPHEIVDIEIHGLRHYDVIQDSGDAMFVPSGWYHQVKNLEDTISVNHNWINGNNIESVYLDMEKHLEDVKSEIADCEGDSEFVEQCQIVLNASFGMDFKEFLTFINHIASKRLSTETPLRNLFKYDLLRIKDVLDRIIVFKDVKKLKLFDKAQELLCKIEECVN